MSRILGTQGGPNNGNEGERKRSEKKRRQSAREKRKERVAKERAEAQKVMYEERILEKENDDRGDVRSHYTFGKELGRGATATVYAVKSKSSGTQYACKIVNKGQLVKMFGRNILARARQSIRTEISIGMSLKHKNIVQLKECFENDANIYYIMEFCNGGEIFKFIQSCDLIRESHVTRIVFQITSALEYLHSRDILHRDLKPANVLVMTTSFNAKLRERSAAGVTVKLTDFGLSKKLESHSNKKATTNSFVGTPSHMAPEMYMKNRKYGASADMWSLGILTYILLSGTRPFNERQVMAMQTEKVSFLKFPARHGWNNVSDYAKDFLRKLLVVDPTKRMSASEAMDHTWFLGLGDKRRRRGASLHQSASKRRQQQQRKSRSKSTHRLPNKVSKTKGREAQTASNTKNESSDDTGTVLTELSKSLQGEEQKNTTLIVGEPNQTMPHVTKPRKVKSVVVRTGTSNKSEMDKLASSSSRKDNELVDLVPKLTTTLSTKGSMDTSKKASGNKLSLSDEETSVTTTTTTTTETSSQKEATVPPMESIAPRVLRVP